MAQQAWRDRLQLAGFVGGLALAGSLAFGCGGQAPGAARDGTAPAAPGAALPGALAGGESPSVPLANVDSTVATTRTENAPQPVSMKRSGDTSWAGSSDGSVGGSLFIETSPRGSTLELVDASGRICVRGQLAPVPNGDYPNYWGAEVGLLLVASATEEAPAAEALQTPGFAFRLQGTLPPLLRFRVGAVGEAPLSSQYCEAVPLNTGSRIEVPLAALSYECWNAGGPTFPRESGATLLSWQIPANEVTEDSFDFCIEDIGALP